VIECTYGLQKRLNFVANVISITQPSRVLDVGCGTGANLTELLAQKFPQSHFTGIDSDTASIAFAKDNCKAKNVQYLIQSDALDLGHFDLVIASEVIEHVEDPLAFLQFLRARLTSTGCVVLTLPNGYGPYELASLVETLMHLTGVYGILRALKRMRIPKPAVSVTVDTLAISPHINFFTYSSVRSLIAASGFRITQFRSRTFLCGFGFDHLMRSKSVISWNCEIADRLPPQLVSDWLFIVKPSVEMHSQPISRNFYSRIRRYLNERRFGLK
jgi:SAM-dependent methyltransferase